MREIEREKQRDKGSYILILKKEIRIFWWILRYFKVIRWYVWIIIYFELFWIMVIVFDSMIFVVNFAFVIVCIVWFDVWLLALWLRMVLRKIFKKKIAIMSGRVLWVLWFKSLSLKIIEHIVIFCLYSILLMKRRSWINWVKEVQSCFALESVDGSLRRNPSWYQILEKWFRQILS